MITEFFTVREMLEQIIIPEIQKIQASLKSKDGSLKITTNWFLNGGEELVCAHEMLGVSFKNMQVIINPIFFKQFGLLKPYPAAYHELTKNAKWESIDTIVKRGDEVLVNPIAFISLISCFKGRASSRQIDLSNILNHLRYPDTEKRLIVILSSEEDVKMKEIEIETAKTCIMGLSKSADIGEFKISDERGGYRGFWTSF